MADDDNDPLGYSSTYGPLPKESDEGSVPGDAKQKSSDEPVGSGVPKAIGIRDPSGHPYDNPDAYIEEQRRIYDSSQKAVEDYNAIVAPYREKLYRAYTEEMQTQNQGPRYAPEPNMPNVPPPDPSQERSDKVTGQGWGAVGEALGIGLRHAIQRGLAASTPQLIFGENARNGFGAAIGGLAAKPYTGTATQQYEEYKMALDATERYNRQQNETYKDLLANKKLQLEDAVKLIGLVSNTYLDPVIQKLANAKDLPGLTKEMDNRDKAERNRLNAINKWNQEWQKEFIKKHSDYVFMLQEKGIDLTDPSPGAFAKGVKEANKKYPLEKFLEENKPKQAVDEQGNVKPRYSIDQEKKQDNDPLGIRGQATSQQKDDFSKEINSYLNNGGQ